MSQRNDKKSQERNSPEHSEAEEQKAETTEHITDDTPRGHESSDDEEAPMVSNIDKKKQNITQDESSSKSSTPRATRRFPETENEGVQFLNQLNERVFENKVGYVKATKQISRNTVLCGECNSTFSMESSQCGTCHRPNDLWIELEDTKKDHPKHTKAKKKDPHCSKCVIL